MSAPGATPTEGDELIVLSGTFAEAFQRTAAARAEQPALRSVGDPEAITWGGYAARVESIARGLAAIGVGRGDSVALMMTNRPEFNLCDTAVFHLGGIPFSVYNTLTAEQIRHQLDNADAKVAIVEAAFVTRVQEAAEGTGVERIICIDGEPDGAESLAAIEAGGDQDFDFEAAWRAVEPDDVVTLIYTSGTTGPPKGVELTHRNLLENLRGFAELFGGFKTARVLSYLPSAHVADRYTTHYVSIVWGDENVSLADATQLATALLDARPTRWVGVPRVWEKLMAALQAQGVADPATLPDDAKAGVRAKLGLDELEYAFCGAAPIPVEVLEYFGKLGIEIYEVWGMSELATVGTANAPSGIKVGSVGRVFSNAEVKLADDGELLFRGPMVMKGYRKQPEKNAEAIDAEGWLHTGDIAEIDDEGFVTIVDRKKELIINAAGKNMSPANIEQRVKASSPLIGQAVAIGDRRKYVAALITLDPEVAPVWAEKAGIAEREIGALAANEAVLAEVQKGIDAANEHLARVEQVKRFRVLPEEWLPGGDELTPTMKLKRKPIDAKHADEIEALYD